MFYDIVMLGLGFAIAYACYLSGHGMGKREMLAELKDHWEQARCRECGAVPQPRLVHVSGCESGWPEPASLKLPGEP